MISKSAIIASVVAGLAFVSAPDFAFAEPKHCPPGHAMKGWCKQGQGAFHFRDRDRDYDRDSRSRLGFQDDLDDAYDEGFRDGLREGRYQVGQRLPGGLYDILPPERYYQDYGRRLDDRYYYADIDGERYLIEAVTGEIVRALLR